MTTLLPGPDLHARSRGQDRRRILVEVGDASSFPTAGHLASYAGLAPVTRRSGTSIKGEHPDRAGNKRLKNALFLSAFAALHDPESGPTTTANRREARNTTPPSSAWPDAASTSSTPCCATAPTTSPNTPPRLDKPHRDTPVTFFMAPRRGCSAARPGMTCCPCC